LDYRHDLTGLSAVWGKGNERQKVMTDTVYTYIVDAALNEDKIWRTDIAPRLGALTPNVRRICQYGFTEMANNVIAHSGSRELIIHLSIDDTEVVCEIIDKGVGIFAKVQQILELDDPGQSIVELLKGKFTSDPAAHSGEGIFFTARIFDTFSIRSGRFSFVGGRNRDLIWEEPGGDALEGTTVRMVIQTDSSLDIADIFNEYTDPDKQPGFHKTSVPVKLMEYGGDSLMSRSQAKRLITRFDRFLEVTLDFAGVDMIGQGFADEVFRVFAKAHPQVRLCPINCTRNVANMIHHVGGSL
jgi:anti-sigma regulatory factor (Ser/Thr protein kinase)